MFKIWIFLLVLILKFIIPKLIIKKLMGYISMIFIFKQNIYLNIINAIIYMLLPPFKIEGK